MKTVVLAALITVAAAPIAGAQAPAGRGTNPRAALVPHGLYRGPEDANAYMPYMFAAHLLIGFGLTWLYRKGMEPGRSVFGQGLRFGAAVAVMSTIPGYLVYYAVQPLPARLVHKQMVLSTLAILLLGVLLAWLNPARKAL